MYKYITAKTLSRGGFSTYENRIPVAVDLLFILATSLSCLADFLSCSRFLIQEKDRPFIFQGHLKFIAGWFFDEDKNYAYLTLIFGIVFLMFFSCRRVRS